MSSSAVWGRKKERKRERERVRESERERLVHNTEGLAILPLTYC